MSQHIHLSQPHLKEDNVNETSSYYWYFPPCLQFGIIIFLKNLHTNPSSQQYFDTPLLIWQTSSCILTTAVSCEETDGNDKDGACLSIEDKKKRRQ